MGAVGRLKPLVIALIVAAIGALVFFLTRGSDLGPANRSDAGTASASGSEAATSSVAVAVTARDPKNDFAENNPATPLATAQPSVTKKQKTDPIILTAANFESFVLRCFQGEECRLGDDPMKMYKDFKLAGDTKACDDLIAFLRRELLEPDLRDKYKDLVKELIDDFYPPDKREFQDAAYYAYVGDLQHSLDLYMDMDAKAKANPDLPPAPPLNVANVLFDMGKYREALPYYEAALNEYDYGAQTLTPSTSEMIRSIQQRIDQVKAKLK